MRIVKAILLWPICFVIFGLMTLICKYDDGGSMTLDTITTKHPAQVHSLRTYHKLGWEFVGYGANDSVDIKLVDNLHYTARYGYIRTDGTFRDV